MNKLPTTPEMDPGISAEEYLGRYVYTQMMAQPYADPAAAALAQAFIVNQGAVSAQTPGNPLADALNPDVIAMNAAHSEIDRFGDGRELATKYPFPCHCKDND